MAARITVSFSDGSSYRTKYRLPAIARFLKREGNVKYKQMKKTPLFPWLMKMAMNDVDATANGREIARIEVREKVI